MIRGIVFILMAGTLILGLHYTGFVDLFPENTFSESPEDFSPYGSTDSPQVSIKNLKGKPFSIENLRGQVVLLNFWASWCLPCRKEFPDLVSTVEWAKGKVALLSISNDSSKEDIQNFLDYLKQNGLNLNQKDIHIVWDSDFEVSKKFNVLKWPETFILDQNLHIVKKQVGVFSFQEINLFLLNFCLKKNSLKF